MSVLCPRTPLKVFIVVSLLCLLSSSVAGSGLYKATSENKYSNLKNTRQYEAMATGDEGAENTFHVPKSALLDVAVTDADEEEADSPWPWTLSWWSGALPRSQTLVLGAVGFVASYGEGGIATWSVIYYERYLSVSDSLNSMGYITFMVCMAGGRFACDTLR